MKLQWKSEERQCLAPVLGGTQNRELTQELILPGELPDAGRVQGAWGQCILRGKQWQSTGVSCNGGAMVWVLYAPEDGTEPRVLDTWVPFQMDWEMPEGTAEGQLLAECMVRSVEARALSPRKLTVRVGVAASVRGLSPMTFRVGLPEETPGVELRRETYPMTLYREAGEREFHLDEELTLPQTPEKLVYYRLQPRVTDEKVLTGRLVFRGTADVHVLYRTAAGELVSAELPVSFSQFVTLEGEYGAEARGELAVCLTGAELDMVGENRLHLKCSLVSQYAVADREPVTLAEDAYSPGRELQLGWETLTLPAVLENRTESRHARQSIPVQGARVADVSFQPEPPALRDGKLSQSGSIRLLYYREDGALETATARWEDSREMQTHENTRLHFRLPVPREVSAQPEGGGVAVSMGLPLEWTATAEQTMNRLTELELGEPQPLDPERPSLILCRAGARGLWDVAKETGSTVAAIRQANALTGDPEPTRMLLIPIS